MSADWFEVTIDVPSAWADAVANFLIESGAPGIQSDDRGGTTTVVAHFSEEPSVQSIRRFYGNLCDDPNAADALHIAVRMIAGEDWAENWKLHFQPQLVGRRLYICPSWDATPPLERIAIVIDPGMAFGTGHHATTRSCLEMLERIVEERRTNRALDVGTGSGILAIVLAKLGVEEIWAVDNDPCALAVATENAARNRVSEHLRFAPGLEEVSGTFDIITANLFARVLGEFAPGLAAILRPDGSMICSGLLTSDEAELRTQYERLGLVTHTRHADGEWVTLELRHRASL